MKHMLKSLLISALSVFLIFSKKALLATPKEVTEDDWSFLEKQEPNEKNRDDDWSFLEEQETDEDSRDDWGFLGEDENKTVTETEKCLTCEGSFIFCYDYFKVNGDNGRFREDQWINDKGRGGIERLRYECPAEDENGYRVTLEGKAIFDDWYEADLFVEKENGDIYLNAGLTGWRHYFDGTSKFPNSPSISNKNIYLDRDIYFLEVGLRGDADDSFVLGWHRQAYDGQSTTLRGLKRSGSLIYNDPSILHQDEVTDIFYSEIVKIYRDKYNVRLRTEYERYDDRRRGRLSSEKSFREDDDFRVWRQYALLDTYFNNCSYLFLGYFFYDVNNTTERDFTNEFDRLIYTQKDNGNRKYDHALLARYNNNRLGNVCYLTFDAKIRAEYNKTRQRAHEDYLETGETLPYGIKGDYDQWKFEEAALINYRGFYRWTLALETLFEQRYEDRKWLARTQDKTKRKTDVDFMKQQFTITATHRFNNSLRSTLRARYKRMVRDFHEKVNTTPFYPGYLNDFLRNCGEATLKTEYRLSPTLLSFFYYQWREYSFKTDLGGRTGRWTAHRAGKTISWQPRTKLYIMTTGIYENYRLDTPTNPCPPPDGNWKRPSKSYDYRGDNFTVELDATYGFNPNTIFKFSYRHTEALGTQDFAGRYSYDQADFCLNANLCGIGGFNFCYTFINFNDRRKKDDDYEAHGAKICWEHAF